MIPIIFIGSTDFSLKCLNFLIESQKFEIKALVTVSDRQRDRGQKVQGSPVKSMGDTLRIPVYTPEDFKDEGFLKEISQQGAQFCVVCSYGKILPLHFLNLFPRPSVNIHPSLLPRWRGAAPIERALMAGDTQTGVSLQLVAQKLDTGDLVNQISFSVEGDETAEDIYKKAEQASKTLLQESLVSYFEKKIKPEPQGEQVGCLAHKIDKKEAEIVWSQPAQVIHNQVRALVLGPQAHTFLKNNRIKIYKTQIFDENFPLDSFGKVVRLSSDQMIVSCGQGSLSLKEVQREGRKKQDIKEFLKGFPLELGASFNSQGD